MANYSIQNKGYLTSHHYKYDLSLSINPFGCSSNIQNVVVKYCKYIHKYPLAMDDKLIMHLQKLHSIEDSNQIIFGQGIDGIIYALGNLLFNRKTHLVMPEVSFRNISFSASFKGASIDFIPMQNDLNINFNALLKKDQKNTIFFICNPNNPTGILKTKKDILKFILETKSLVIVDEAGLDNISESVMSYCNTCNNLIVLRSFSKIYGLAGMRIGYAVLPKNLIKLYVDNTPPFKNSILAQKVAYEALLDEKFILNSRKKIKQEHNYLKKELVKLGFVNTTRTSHMFMSKIPDYFPTADLLCEKLHIKDCNVVNLSTFKKLNNRYIRLTPRKHNINKEFINRIRQICNNY